jgi:4,5-dihydroxyphthalate decarboxylase
VTNEKRIKLQVAIGAKTWREGLYRAQPDARSFVLDFAEVSPIHRAFAPMIREQKFDLSEIAVATVLQALAYRKPLLLLPVTVAARFQHKCLVGRKSDGIKSPTDLVGRKVAVRAYTQTTGVWVRGILENDYGVPSDAIRWVTQEDAHIAEYRDPAWVERAAADRSLVDLLRSGDVDAAIFGNDLPDESDLVPIISEPCEAAKIWFDKHRVVPINHMLVLRKDVALSYPDTVREIWSVLSAVKPQTLNGQNMSPIGIEENMPALAMMLKYCQQQQIVTRELTIKDIFAETTELLRDVVDTP